MGRTNDQSATKEDQPPNSGLWGHVEVEALPNPGSLPPPPIEDTSLRQGTLVGFVMPQPASPLSNEGPTRRTPTAGTAQVRIGTKTLTAGLAPPVNLESTAVPQTTPIGVIPKDTMLSPGGQPQARGYYHANQATRTLIGGSLPAPEPIASAHQTLNLAGARRATAPGFATLPGTASAKNTLVAGANVAPSGDPESSGVLHPTERSPAAITSPELKAITQQSGAPAAERASTPGAAASHLGRFRIQKRLGSGGVGAVYLATKVDAASGGHQLLAVKVLREHFYRDPSTLKALFREARLAARMDHRHIVRVFDIGYHNKHPYLVMEYVDGLSLTTLLQQSNLPLAVGIRCLIDTLHGLDFAHKLRGDEGEPLGLVHCDVSPQNILVGVDGVTKVTDFGVARTREEDGDEFVLRCKPEFAAPELLRGEPVRPESDVFSAGAVLYRIATGQPAFSGSTEEEIADKLLHAEPTPPTQVRPGLPEFLDAFCAQAMAKSHGERFKSCLEMARSLEKHAEAVGLLADRATVGAWVQNVRRVMEHGDGADLMAKRPTAGDTATPPPTLRERKPRPLLGLSLAIVALVVLAAIGWWTAKRPKVDAEPTPPVSLDPPPQAPGFAAGPSLATVTVGVSPEGETPELATASMGRAAGEGTEPPASGQAADAPSAAPPSPSAAAAPVTPRAVPPVNAPVFPRRAVSPSRFVPLEPTPAADQPAPTRSTEVNPGATAPLASGAASERPLLVDAPSAVEVPLLPAPPSEPVGTRGF